MLVTSILCGALCGLTAVNGKIFILTLTRSTSTYDFVTNISAWICGVMNIISVFANLYNLNLTASLFSQLLTMPPYECSIIFGNLICGGLVMNEFNEYTSSQLFTIVTGCALCMCGIMYKVCTLESADLEKEESYKSAPSDMDIELNETKESSCDEKYIKNKSF